MTTEIEQLAALLQTSRNIVFFGGAGVSTESGIPDFRSAQGLWNEKLQMNFTPEQLVSHTFFLQYPEEFFSFYRAKLLYPEAQPNACHRALARLEQAGPLVPPALLKDVPWSIDSSVTEPVWEVTTGADGRTATVKVFNGGDNTGSFYHLKDGQLTGYESPRSRNGGPPRVCWVPSAA